MPIGAVLWRVSGHFNHAHIETTYGHECIPLGKWLQSKGFRVAEHPAFGGVHPVHKGRAHYEGRAIDVNFGPGGESAIEKRAFDALIPSVIRRGRSIADVTGVKVPVPKPPPPKEEPLKLDAQDQAFIANQIGTKVAKGCTRVINHVEKAIAEESQTWAGYTEKQRVEMEKRLNARLKGVETELLKELEVQGLD